MMMLRNLEAKAGEEMTKSKSFMKEKKIKKHLEVGIDIEDPGIDVVHPEKEGTEKILIPAPNLEIIKESIDPDTE